MNQSRKMRTIPTLAICLIYAPIAAWAGNWWLTPNSKNIKAGGGSFSVNISNDTDYSLEYTAGTAADWISIGERNYYNTTVNVTIEPNYNLIYSRSGSVTVSAFLSGQTHNSMNLRGYCTCYITQEGLGALFSPQSISFEGTNSVAEITVYVDSGISWELRSSATWLSLDRMRGTGTNVIRVSADKNESDASRTATVKIYDSGAKGSGSYYLSITQSPLPPSHSITYTNTNGADNPNPTSYNEGESFAFEPLNSIAGYCFAGWNPSRINKTDTQDITASATWTPISYTISYDANGGTGEIGNTSATYDSAVSISSNAFNWANHRFVGWATNVNGNVVYAEGVSVSNLTSVANGVVTLYAVWEDYLEAPDFTPESGTIFEDRLSISISCASEEATIHYTTNGSNPTVDSPVYHRFRITNKTMVKAIAELNGVASEIAVAEYAKGRCADPVVSLPDGFTFEHSGQSVSISYQASDGVLRYTLDGNDPTEQSPIYGGSFSINESTTVKAKVFSDSFFDSSVVTATLNRVWVEVATPHIDAGATFTGSKTKVALSCPTEGAIIRYTLNGADPNSHSIKYSVPFYVDNSCIVKAYATKSDYRNSAIAMQVIAKAWCIGDTMGKPDHVFSTTGTDGHGWVRVGDETAPNGEAMKSGAITHNQNSILSTKVMGPGILSFSWRASCENDPDYEWDHAECKIDGKLVRRICGETSWRDESIPISGDREHTIEWWYIKDDVESEGADSVWVARYVWTSLYTATQTSYVPVPYAWLEQCDSQIIDEYDAYEAAANATAANGRKVWECYVAGIHPTNENSVFTAKIEMVDGSPIVTWSPKLDTEQEALRIYTVYGKTNLNDKEWHSPTNAQDRFFTVGVEMR